MTPTPEIARPGDLLARGPNHRWLAYTVDGTIATACYLHGRLLRRDARGWWTAGPRGQRVDAPTGDVAALVGTVPAGFTVLAEQAPLVGSVELRKAVAA